MAKKLSPNEFGKVYLINGKYYIIFDDTLPIDVCRFTVAHELGHIFLGHLEMDECSCDVELEAEAFAALLFYTMQLMKVKI